MKRHAGKRALGPALGGLLAAAAIAGTVATTATAANAIVSDQPLTVSARAAPATSREIDYGPPQSRFTAAFPTTPKHLADTGALLQGFPKGTHAYAFWVSPVSDLLASSAPVPPPPTFLIAVWVLPATASSGTFLGSLMKRFGRFPGLVKVDRGGLAGYRYLGSVRQDPLNEGSTVAAPAASEGELVARRGTSFYRVLAVTARQSAAQAFLASFRPVTSSGTAAATNLSGRWTLRGILVGIGFSPRMHCTATTVGSMTLKAAGRDVYAGTEEVTISEDAKGSSPDCFNRAHFTVHTGTSSSDVRLELSGDSKAGVLVTTSGKSVPLKVSPNALSFTVSSKGVITNPASCDPAVFLCRGEAVTTVTYTKRR